MNKLKNKVRKDFFYTNWEDNQTPEILKMVQLQGEIDAAYDPNTGDYTKHFPRQVPYRKFHDLYASQSPQRAEREG